MQGFLLSGYWQLHYSVIPTRCLSDRFRVRSGLARRGPGAERFTWEPPARPSISPLSALKLLAAGPSSQRLGLGGGQKKCASEVKGSREEHGGFVALLPGDDVTTSILPVIIT